MSAVGRWLLTNSRVRVGESTSAFDGGDGREPLVSLPENTHASLPAVHASRSSLQSDLMALSLSTNSCFFDDVALAQAIEEADASIRRRGTARDTSRHSATVSPVYIFQHEKHSEKHSEKHEKHEPSSRTHNLLFAVARKQHRAGRRELRAHEARHTRLVGRCPQDLTRYKQMGVWGSTAKGARAGEERRPASCFAQSSGSLEL